MAKKLKIHDKDKGMRVLLKALSAAKTPVVAVGVLGDGGKYDDDGPTVLQVATEHEFGIGVPKRSFIRDTVDINRDKILKRLRNAARVSLKDPNGSAVAMARIGLYVEGVIKRRIAAGISPANSQETIDRKGSSKPLIDTGQLRNSIASEVRTR